MTIVFRAAYVALLGGLVLLWYLDFEPSRVGAFLDPVRGISSRGAEAESSFQHTASGSAGIAQRLSAVEAAVSSLAAAIPPPVDVERLDRRMAALDARMEAVARAVSEDAPTSQDPPNTDRLERRLSELGERIAALAARPAPRPDLSRLEARLASIEESLANPPEAAYPATLKSDLARLDARLADLPSGLEVRRLLADASTRIEDLETRIAGLAGHVSPDPAVRAAISEIEAKLETMAERAVSEGQAAADAGERLDARLAAIDARLAATEEAVTEMVAARADSEVLEAGLAGLEAKLDTLEAEIAGLAARPVAEIDTSALAARLDALDTAIAGLAARPAATLETGQLEARLDAFDAGVEARLEAMEADLARLAARPAPELDAGALEAGIAELTARLGGIEGRLTATDTSEVAAELARLDARLAGIADAIENSGSSNQGAETGTTAPPGPEPATAEGTVIRTTGQAWLRIRDGARIIFEGLVPGGERIPLPPGLAAPELRAGNAGSVFVVVDGVPYGPLGRPDEVVRDVSLRAAEIRARLPRARPGAVDLRSAG